MIFIKRYSIFVLVLFFVLLSINTTHSEELPLLHKVITIDPGHGGRDPGTRFGNILEKNLNLEISKVLKEKLEEQGAIVFLIRDKDIDFSKNTDYRKKRGDLKRRIGFIEKNKSDLYLSIHLNWYNDYYYRGAEILYNDINKENLFLAEIMKKSLCNKGIKTRDIKTTDLFLYRNIKTPGLLVECGFLSNRNDRYLLQQKWYQEKLSIAIINGLILYFNK